MDIKSEGNHNQALAYLCIAICFLVFPNSAAAAGASEVNRNTRRLPIEGERLTINCSFLKAEYRGQRLCLVCSKVLNEEDIVVFICTHKMSETKRRKLLLHVETLIILANSRQVNTLLHPDLLEHVPGADSRTLQNTRGAKCSRRYQD